VGAKLLHDSLARLPGVTVSRNYLPLETVRENGSVVLMLAMDAHTFSGDAEAIEQVTRFVRRGNRAIVALSAKSVLEHGLDHDLERAWHVRIALDKDRKHVHGLYFADAREWHVLERVGDKLLAIERDFGRGSIALFAESDDFNNLSTAAADRLELVSTALGSYDRIVFDEQHLGIAESGSIVGLARRFHLTGMAIGLGICAALFIWRSAAGFPPPAPSEAARLAGRTSHGGLLTLLRRHIPPGQLTAACWQEWVAVNRRAVPTARIEQASMVIRDPGEPLEAVRQIHAILKGKP
jgi:hypothetical protein